MTVRTLTARIPYLEVLPGMIVRLEAISPTSGAAVSGVTATHWAIYGDDVGGGAGDISSEVATWVWGDSTVQV